MLFPYPSPRPLAFVMRDCKVPIDVAFPDAGGRVLNVHTMKAEPPRREDESAAAYESRLPSYASAGPPATPSSSPPAASPSSASSPATTSRSSHPLTRQERSR
jgi:hypothetical protein